MLRQTSKLARFVVPQCQRATMASTKEPSYTYLPPGCSMREPVYISLSDPVYFYDLPPSRLGGPADKKQPQQQQQQSQQQQEAKGSASSSSGLKNAFDALSGGKAVADTSNKPHAYRMIDDLSQQPYIVSLRHSMREPKYVSVTDPKYPIASK